MTDSSSDSVFFPNRFLGYRFIERPSLPPLLIVGLLFWGSCAAFITFAGTLDKSILESILLISSICFIVLVIVFVFFFQKKTRKLILFAFAIIAVFLGILCSFVDLDLLENTRSQLSESKYDEYTFTILDSPVKSDKGYSCTADFTNENGVCGTVRLYINNDSSPAFGQVVSSSGTFSLPQEKNLSSYQSNGLCGYIEIDSFQILKSEGIKGLIVDLRSNYLTQWRGDGSVSDIFLKALLLGERGELYTTIFYQDVKVLGLAHIIAVSGAHLVTVSTLISLVVSRLPVSRVLSVGIQVAFMGIYLVLVGIPLPCLRAACMSFASLIAPLFFRRSSPLSNLGFALLVLIALDPFCALSLSFNLSAFATLGIVLFMPLFSNLVFSISNKIPSFIADPVLMTISSLLLVSPLTVASFSQFSLISPVANVLATPIVTLICCLGMIMLLFSPLPFVGDLLFSGCSFLAEVFIGMCALLVKVPFVSIPASGNVYALSFVALVFAGLLWTLWPKRINTKLIASTVFILIIAFSISVFFPRGNRMIMLDVGQGDAILFQSEGKNILVDTGNQDSLLLAGLARYNVLSLDAVIISHADDDHCGSLSALRGVVLTKTVILAEGANAITDESSLELVSQANLVSGNSITYVSSGDTVRIGSLAFKVVNPEPLTNEYGNDESLCFVVMSDDNHDSIADSTILLCGDAESEVIEPLVDKGVIPSIDILKVAHHGSKKSLTPEILSKTKASIALISVGKNNTYGHPSFETTALLEEYGLMVERTDEQGDLVWNIGSSNNKDVLPQVQ